MKKGFLRVFSVLLVLCFYSSTFPLSAFAKEFEITPATADYSGVVKGDGTVWLWGNNKFSQIGNESTANVKQPYQLPGFTNVKMLALGGGHTIALKKDGTVWTWGNNKNGQLGNSTTATKNKPTKIDLTDVIYVAAGFDYSFAIKEDGSVYGWGNNSTGQLGDNTTSPKSKPTRITALTGAQKIFAGYNYAFAIMSDDSVLAWGNNAYGQLGDGSNLAKKVPTAIPALEDIKDFATSFNHVIATKRDNTVWVWGNNNYGQLGLGHTDKVIVPIQNPALSDAVSVATGLTHTVVIKSDGSAWSFGGNQYGQLGDGTTDNSTSPVKVKGDAYYVSAVAGDNHSILYDDNEQVFSFGYNASGQLGDNSGSDQAAPVSVLLNYSVEYGIANQGKMEQSIEGYIVGQPVSAGDPVLNADFVSDYAIAIADSINETDNSKLLFVKLLGTPFASTFGLKSNPTKLGNKIIIKGDLNPYYAPNSGITEVTSITEKTVPVEGLSFTPSTITIYLGDQATPKPVLSPTNATNKNLTWKSSSSSIVSVTSDGVIKGLKKGSAVITATTVDGDYSAKLTVTVGETAITRIDLNETSSILTVGSTATLTASIEPANATTKQLQWYSTKPNLVSVTKSTDASKSTQATIKALKVTDPETVDIFVMTESGGLTAKCTVKVVALSPTDILLATPVLTGSKTNYVRGESISISVKLAGNVPAESISSAYFEMDYDPNVFSLATNSLDKDVIDGTLPLTDKSSQTATNKNTIKLLFASTNTQIPLNLDDTLFTVNFKVRTQAEAGAKAFTFRAGQMTTPTGKLLLVNNNAPQNVDVTIGQSTIQSTVSIYFGDVGSDLYKSCTSHFTQAMWEELFGKMVFTLKKTSTDAGLAFKGSDIFTRDSNGNTVSIVNGQPVATMSASVLDMDYKFLKISGPMLLAKSKDIILDSTATVAIGSDTAPVMLYIGDIGSATSSTFSTVQDGKMDLSDFGLWMKTFKAANTMDTPNTDQLSIADLNKDGKIDNIDFTLWLINYQIAPTDS